MKLLVLLLLSSSTFAQPYLGIGAGSGVTFYAGINVEKVQVQYSFQIPYSSATRPYVNSFTIGYGIGNNIVVTPEIGIAANHLAYGGELSRTWYMGRLFAYGNNYGYGIGIKCILKD